MTVTGYIENAPGVLFYDLCEVGEAQTPFGTFEEPIDTLIRIPFGADNGLCDSLINILVIENIPPSIQINKQLLDCALGGTEMELSIETLTGVQYSWTTVDGNIVGPSDQASILIDATGTYALEVSQLNANGTKVCSREDVVSVTTEDLAPLTFSLRTTDVDCFGENSGEARASVLSGAAPFLFEWSVNTSTNTNLLDNLSAGNYTVSITANNGCTTFEPFSIDEPDELSISSNITAPNCLNEKGLVELLVQGGTAPYIYEWPAPLNVTGSQAELEVGGPYTISVTDNNNCQTTTSVTIQTVFDFPFSKTNVSCNGNDGSALVEVPNSSDYEVKWSDGSIGDQLSGLVPGTYGVSVSNLLTTCVQAMAFTIQGANNCGIRISGNIYNDDAAPDCVLDGQTLPLPNLEVVLNNGQVTTSDAGGFYEFLVNDPGNYTIEVLYEEAIYTSLCSDPIEVTVNNQGTDVPGNDFYLISQSPTDLAVRIVKETAEGGKEHQIRIIVINQGEVSSNYDLTFNFPTNLEYVRTSPFATNVNTGTGQIQWIGKRLLPGFASIFRAYFVTPQSLAAGTPLAYDALITPLTGDRDPFNNSAVCIDEVQLPSAPISSLRNAATETGNISVNIYPNPASQQVFFELELTDSQVVGIRINELRGKVVWEQVAQRKRAGQHRYTAQLDQLPAGIYWVTFELEGERITRKLIVY